MVPLVGIKFLTSKLSRVDLPDPLSPIKATRCLGLNLKLTFSNNSAAVVKLNVRLLAVIMIVVPRKNWCHVPSRRSSRTVADCV